MANITELLAALSNLPPVSGAPPLTPLPASVQPPTDFNLPSSITPLEPPPMAPGGPPDRRIIDEYLKLVGQAPTPPPPQAPASKLDRIAAALGGISAGLQGRGPEYVASLRAEHERPQREFEAKQQQYQQQRAQFGLAGLQAAQSAEEKRQTRATAEADRRFEIDFQQKIKQMGFDDQVAIEKMREAMQAQRDKERERAQDEKLLQQQKLKFSETLGNQIKFYRGNGIKDPNQARRLALNDYRDIAGQLGIEVPQLTGADNERLAKVEAYVARLQRVGTGGGGGGGSDKIVTLAELADGSIVPFTSQVAQAAQGGILQVKRVFSPQLMGTGGGGAPGAPGTSGAPAVDTESLKQNMFATVLKRKQAGAPFADVLKEIRGAAAPAGVSSGDWSALKNFTITKAQEEYGYRKPQAPSAAFDPRTMPRSVR